MTLKYIWRSFQPRLSFLRPFQQSLACFCVARFPSNSWASCTSHHLFVKLRSVNFILNEYWIGLDWTGVNILIRTRASFYYFSIVSIRSNLTADKFVFVVTSGNFLVLTVRRHVVSSPLLGFPMCPRKMTSPDIELGGHVINANDDVLRDVTRRDCPMNRNTISSELNRSTSIFRRRQSQPSFQTENRTTVAS